MSPITKQVAIYLIRWYTGLTNGEIGKIFKMKAQAVSKAGIKIERLMKENRKIKSQVNKLISRADPFFHRKQEAKMLQNYTAKYSKIASGYMGQLIEWPEVVTEGGDIEECRMMLRDALNEMLLAYKKQGKEIPMGGALIEQVPIEVQDVCQTA